MEICTGRTLPPKTHRPRTPAEQSGIRWSDSPTDSSGEVKRCPGPNSARKPPGTRGIAHRIPYGVCSARPESLSRLRAPQVPRPKHPEIPGRLERARSSHYDSTGRPTLCASSEFRRFATRRVDLALANTEGNPSQCPKDREDATQKSSGRRCRLTKDLLVQREPYVEKERDSECDLDSSA